MTATTSPHGSAAAATDVEALARAYVAMWNERDEAAIPRLVAEEFVMYDPAVPAKGVPGPKGEAHGRDGLRAFMTVLDTAFPDFEVRILNLLFDERLAMYEVELTMTHDGPLGGLPPTGRHVELRGASVLRIEDGAIVEHRFHTNMADSAEQLGLTLPAILAQLPRLAVRKVRSLF